MPALVHFRENSELLRSKALSLASAGLLRCEPYPWRNPARGLVGVGAVGRFVGELNREKRKQTDGGGDRGGFFWQREGPESGPATAYRYPTPKVPRGRV